MIAWSTDEKDARVLLDILSLMNNVINDQLALNLVDICLDNTLHMLRKSLLCFSNMWKIDFLTVRESWERVKKYAICLIQNAFDSTVNR